MERLSNQFKSGRYPDFQVTDQLGAILNEDGTLNTPDNPASRGWVAVVFCMGLGAVTRQGNLMVAEVSATGLVQVATWTAAFSG
jgi:uncharacterized protein (TIGR03437 family)